MVTLFWDSVGVILIDFMSKGATINSDDLALSNFHLFGCLKESLREQHFSSDEEVKTAVKKWLKTQPVEFCNEGICALVKRWEKAV